MSHPMPNQIPSRWRCIECDHEFDEPAAAPERLREQAGTVAVCTECGAEEQFEQIGGLTPVAIATLGMAGITPQQWIEAASYGYVPPAGQTLTWSGDLCGCTDDRCANGFHHMGLTDCGCLPVLIDEYLSKGLG
jgi:hypothetical protein